MLRQIYAASVSSGGLLAALTAAAFGAVTKTASGKVLVEAQSAGVVTKYELETGSGAVSQSDITEICAGLMNLYDRAVGSTSVLFAGGYGQGLWNDAAIYAWMLSQLQVVRSYSPDFSDPGIR